MGTQAETVDLYKDAMNLLEAGQRDQAKAALISLLEKERMAEAYNELGKIFFAEGDSDSAFGCFDEAITIDPGYDEALANAAEVFLKEGIGLQALEFFGRAIRARPDHLPYRDRFIAILGNLEFKVFVPELRNLLLNCIETPGVDLGHVGRAWISILKTDPSVSEVIKLLDVADYEQFKGMLLKSKNFGGFTDPLFVAGLRRIRFYSLEFEGLLMHTRRFLLEHAGHISVFGDPRLFLKMAEPLALYAYKTDYIFDVSEAEGRDVAALKAEIEGRTAFSPEDAAAFSVLGAYMSLHTLSNVQTLDDEKDRFKEIGLLIAQQVTEPLRLRAIAETIPVLVPVENAVSAEVRQQYEESPYPRWTDFAKRPYHAVFEGQLRGKAAQILVAGCGTGREAIELATVYPDSTILAVDLSRASLSYAIDRARALGLTNVTFKQADILGLGILGAERFDFIASSGVLHHMQEPMKGWAALRGLIKPGGIMRIGLYSRIAHAPLIEAQAKIAQEGLGSRPEDIRLFRKNARKWLGRELYSQFTQMIDYYATAECRDMFFHVQETRYSCLELRDALDELGLSFLGFNLSDAVLAQYRAQYPNDPEAVDLTCWNDFEKRAPRTFAAMYNFWCRKGDRA